VKPPTHQRCRGLPKSFDTTWSIEVLTTELDSETPFDKLAEDVKLGARLIKELDKKLKQVETEVRDAFKELEDDGKKEI